MMLKRKFHRSVRKISGKFRESITTDRNAMRTFLRILRLKRLSLKLRYVFSKVQKTRVRKRALFLDCPLLNARKNVFQVRANGTEIERVSEGKRKGLRWRSRAGFHRGRSINQRATKSNFPECRRPFSGDALVQCSSLERDRNVHEHAAARRYGKTMRTRP